LLLKSIQIKNFRNLNLETNFSPSINIIVGANGSGKSNFLDSIFYLAFAKSFKKYSERNNITYNDKVDFASITAKSERKKTLLELKVVFSIDSNGFERKRLEVNKKLKQKADFIGNIYLSLFAPHNINLLGGTPEMRRDELDDFISVVDKQYLKSISEYKQVLNNRNHLLPRVRDGLASKKELDFWTEKLIELGAYILDCRRSIIDEFQGFVRNEAEVFEKQLKNLEIHYKSRILSEGKDSLSSFQQIINDNYDKELIVGKSLYGPHRDDYDFISGGKDLKIYASRGQQRIVTMIFKTAMWHYFVDVKKVRALLLLDDIMSELDNDNRKKVEKMIEMLATQTFITSTSSKGFTTKLVESAYKINL